MSDEAKTQPGLRAPVDDAALLRVYLAGREVPCPQCGYNLRDLTGDRCPECGEVLALRLQRSEPKQAAALAGLVALSAGAGMNGLCLGYVFILTVIFDQGRFVPYTKFIWVNAVGVLALGILIALWLRYWRHIRGLGAAQRWILVGACAGMSLVDLVIFTKLIR